MPEDITPPVDPKASSDPTSQKDDLGKPMLGRQIEKAPEVPARSAEEQAAYDKLDDAGKKKADEDRLAAIKSAKTDIKPAARTPEEQAAYDKMSDEDKKKDDDARLKKAEEEAKKGEKKEGAPEKYEPFKLPDGVAVDEASQAEFQKTAKELGLSQEGAQKLVDMYAKKQAAASEEFNKSWIKARSDWREEIKNDKEIGGDKLAESTEVALRVIETFGSPRLRQEVLETGWGDHPELFRFCVKVGHATREDRLIEGNPSSKETTPAQRMYPNQGKKNK